MLNVIKETRLKIRPLTSCFSMSLQVIETDTDRSATYENEFLLTFHSNQGPISCYFRDKWQFQSKIANFLNHSIFYPPPLNEGVPLETRMVWATGLSKKFDDIFTRLDTIHEHDRWTETGQQQRPCLRIMSRGNK